MCKMNDRSGETEARHEQLQAMDRRRRQIKPRWKQNAIDASSGQWARGAWSAAVVGPGDQDR
jgi:hypothetical protein